MTEMKQSESDESIHHIKELKKFKRKANTTPQL